MKHLYFATGSDSKFDEASGYFATLSPDVEFDRFEVDVPEIQSDDPDTILRNKVEFVRTLTTKPFIVDDVCFDTELYPGFPGSYAKFVNSTLGKDGLERLFKNGDNVKAIARVALSYLDSIFFFEGQIGGTFNFDNHLTGGPLFNDLIQVTPNQSLGEALEDSEFNNHRRQALAQLAQWLSSRNDNDFGHKSIIGQRWTDRSSTWAEVIGDPESYVNFEGNYTRVNSMIRKFGPIASGKALEIGCGSGEAGRILKASNQLLEVLSTDIADGMLDEARKQTADAGLDIEYRKLDVVKDGLESDTFNFTLSRGVIISHLPKGDIWDYLEAVTDASKDGAYFLFDFIQSVGVGNNVEKPIDTKNEFTLDQIDRIMNELGWNRVDDDGSNAMRVRVVCYRKEVC